MVKVNGHYSDGQWSMFHAHDGSILLNFNVLIVDHQRFMVKLGRVAGSGWFMMRNID